jgi:hypothetical protein
LGNGVDVDGCKNMHRFKIAIKNRVITHPSPHQKVGSQQWWRPRQGLFGVKHCAAIAFEIKEVARLNLGGPKRWRGVTLS